jgi:hypothetical protein
VVIFEHPTTSEKPTIFQSPMLESIKRIFQAFTHHPRVGIQFISANVYEGKDAAEIQLLIRNKPLVISGLVTNKKFNSSSLGELLPLMAPIEVWGKHFIPHHISTPLHPL